MGDGLQPDAICKGTEGALPAARRGRSLSHHDRTRHRPATPRPRRLRGRAACCRSRSAAWSGPFVFFDHMGPVDFRAGHPAHASTCGRIRTSASSTVTYLFDGEIMHRDSVGSEQPIRPGEVNWMIAGRGITHSERFERARREGGRMHGIQAWVALPDERRGDRARFLSPRRRVAADVRGRRGAGPADRGRRRTARRRPCRTHSPMFYVHWTLAPGARIGAARGASRARRLRRVRRSRRRGPSACAPARWRCSAEGPRRRCVRRTPSIVLAIGGEPVGPRFIDWNFVSSSKERIEQAKADWRAGRMKLPDLDHDEFIPSVPMID